MQGNNCNEYFELLKGFLKAQARRWVKALPDGFSEGEWGDLLDLDGSWEFQRVATPTQGNFSDCGPFALGFASYITKCIEENFPFSQEDIAAIRKRVTYDLMYAMREI
jgi:Ulp1 family protease